MPNDNEGKLSVNQRTTKSVGDWRLFKAAKNRATYLMNKARTDFYANLINENSTDQKKLVLFVKKITDICRQLDTDKDKITPKLRISSTSVLMRR